jgi:hypothetical protein
MDMPSWTSKEDRQYEHIKSSARRKGRSVRRAKEIAARTINKQRRRRGATSRSPRGSSRGDLESRTVGQLRDLAANRHIRGRSRMRKHELVEAIRGR